MPAESSTTRLGSCHLASLDAYRGFVILTMIFVNYLAGIEDIPRWAKHLKADEDGYTFVNVVFSGFRPTPPAAGQRG
jgi:predicted acyltransferase